MLLEDAAALHEDRSLTAEIKLYYDLYAPAEVPSPLLITLHGYGDNKRWMMRIARLIAPPHFAIASLQGFYQHLKEPKREGEPLRYGFNWGTNYRPEESIALHHRALLDLIEAVAQEGIAGRERIFLLGFSQSVAINYRFVFTHTQSVRGVVGICGGLPGDWETSERYAQTDTAVLHLCGTRDQYYPPARVSDYAARLRLRARDVELRSYDTGHEIASVMHDDVRAWLDSRCKYSERLT